MRLGSMFTGTGALDLAITEVTGAQTVWVADVCGDPDTKHWPHRTPCKAPCTILAHRFPGVPNLGDVAAIDWTAVTPIEILCAGFPCQDVSVAGPRAGLMDGTRTGLWSEVVRAIAALRPRLVVLENVPGLFTAPAAGDVEPCTWCVGDDPAGNLRALDAVLADLATLGLDANWTTIPASGVGAPHRRERWFCVAYPAGHPWRVEHGDGGAAADAGGEHREQRRLAAPGQAESGRAFGESAGRGGAPIGLMPTPRASDGTKGGPNQRGSSGDLMLPSAVQLLPTPTAKDSAASGGSSPSDVTLTDAVVRTRMGTQPNDRLLPTLSAGAPDAKVSDRARELHGSTDRIADVVEKNAWGQYAAAIARWEHLTRPAPAPTEPGPKGAPRLSPRFSEWMMGLAAGWVTDVPGITRNEALKAAGNGVVVQQAVAALRWLLGERGAA